MNTYILFIFGSFDGHEEVEYFCTEVFPTSSFNTIKYIIENTNNIIIIFNSEMEKDELSKELFTVMTPDHVKFYFLFERDSIVTAHVPQTMKDFIYKISSENMMKIEFTATTVNPNPVMVLDHLLEKIDKDGVSSLTPEEKNFLDNFEI
jgi:hypothetical protein